MTLDFLGLFLGYLAFVFLALLWPLWRTWRRHGVFAITAARASLAERLAVSSLMLAIVVLGGCLATLAVLGWEAIGLAEPGPARRVAGWLLMAGSLALVVKSQADMGASWRIGVDSEPTELVTDGVYRWIRNPIYTGVFGMLAGLAVLLPWWPVLAVGAAVVVGITVQTFREEAHLVAQHGEDWARWAQRTGRFLPRVL